MPPDSPDLGTRWLQSADASQIPIAAGGPRAPLAVLSLGGNRLAGPLPTGIAGLATLEDLDLSENLLHGACVFAYMQ